MTFFQVLIVCVALTVASGFSPRHFGKTVTISKTQVFEVVFIYVCIHIYIYINDHPQFKPLVFITDSNYFIFQDFNLDFLKKDQPFEPKITSDKLIFSERQLREWTVRNI
jgi:hypothetical protein